MPPPPPPEQMRAMLATARSLPIPPDFPTAWDAALKRIRWPNPTHHRKDWKAAMADPVVVEEWRRSYYGEPSTLAPLADLQALGRDLSVAG